MTKRILLFVATNILIMVTISLVVNLLGLGYYLTPYGINWKALAVFCGIWGMTGAFISLALSRFIAKKSMGVQVINTNPNHPLVIMVDILRQRAGLPMPEVGIYDSPEMNAFATGPTKKRSLIAVSSGLLNRMSKDELEGVLSHEISHIANGDMVTMTLIAGVVNSFAMFLSRVISYFVSLSVKEDVAYIVRFVLTIVLDILFSILGSIIVAFFSRSREFKADIGGAAISGKDKMIAALENLQRNFEPIDRRAASLDTLKISGKSKFVALFSTHPALEKRIERLRILN